ncbi:MAG: hypothetical protein LBV00_13370 [Propionibacteriaceae bacterium]|nr:hypothetical protein [Propionibacteriaceae bacterium]
MGKVVGALATVSLAMLLLPSPAYAASSVSLDVGQAFTSSDPADDGVFDYRLTATRPGDPMPEGEDSQEYRFSMSGDEVVTVGPIAYDQAGLYEYELAQIIDPARAGYTYDQRVFLVQVHVGPAPGLVTQVVVRQNDAEGDKVDDVVFAVTEVATTPPPLTQPTPTPSSPVRSDPPVAHTGGTSLVGAGWSPLAGAGLGAVGLVFAVMGAVLMAGGIRSRRGSR